PEPVRALPGRRDLLRGRAALRRLGQRGAPADQARPGWRRAYPVAGAGRGRGRRGELSRPAGTDRCRERGAQRPFSFRLLYPIHRTIPIQLSRQETEVAHTLPELPYAYDALEPHIDAQTMEIHHSKHHQAYINNLDKAIEGTEYADKPAEELIRDLDALPEKIRGAVRNNGGGHANHSLFWTVMSPKGGGQPVGEVAKRIDSDLGGFDKFKE